MKNTNVLNNNSFRFKPLEGYVSEYFEKTYVNYQYNLAGNSINTTVYKLDRDNSTISEGAETKLQMIGPESPYTYLKISNYPIFNTQQVDIPLVFNEESGYSTEIRLECVVHPSNVAIDVDDYIVLNYSTYGNLWRVTEAQPSTFENIYYTRIVLTPTQYSQENIEFQVRKRYAYIFESGIVIDELTNRQVNDLLASLNTYYKVFIANHYNKSGIFIKQEELDSMVTKYFTYEDLPYHVKVYNYYYKKLISNNAITKLIDEKKILSNFIKFKNLDDAIHGIYDDEAKFLYFILYYLEKGKKYSEALKAAFKYVSDKRKKYMKEDPEVAFEAYVKPYSDTVDINEEYYKLILDTSKLIEDTEDVTNTGNINVIKILSNLKKLLKQVSTQDHTNDIVLKTFLLLTLFKTIPFKNITFTSKKIEYGE